MLKPPPDPDREASMAKTKTKKWLIDIDEVDETVDEAMEKILKRDGRRIYEDASSDLLTFYTNTIVHMDGGPKRLLGILRRLEAAHGREKSTKTRTRQADNRSARALT
jgi:hypothetical protein